MKFESVRFLLGDVTVIIGIQPTFISNDVLAVHNQPLSLSVTIIPTIN